MHEDKLYELKEKLIKELEEYAQNGKYSKEDVETITLFSRLSRCKGGERIQ